MAGAKSAAKTPALGSTGAIFHLITLYSMFLISPSPLWIVSLPFVTAPKSPLFAHLITVLITPCFWQSPACSERSLRVHRASAHLVLVCKKDSSPAANLLPWWDKGIQWEFPKTSHSIPVPFEGVVEPNPVSTHCRSIATPSPNASQHKAEAGAQPWAFIGEQLGFLAL